MSSAAKNQTADPNAISAREALLISVGRAARGGGGNIAGVAVAINTWRTRGRVLLDVGDRAWSGMATSLVDSPPLAQLYKRSNGGRHLSGRARRLHHSTGSARNTGGWRSSMRSVSCWPSSFGFNGLPGATPSPVPSTTASASTVCGAGSRSADHHRLHRLWRHSDVSPRWPTSSSPIMAFSYIGLALLVIVLNIGSLPGGGSWSIVANAFGLEGSRRRRP